MDRRGGQAISRSYRSPVRAARAAQTRREILGGARRLFAAQGYAATSVAEIARSVGVSVQTIYNSVGGKSELLLALNDVIDEVAGVGEIQRKIGESEDPQEILALTARLRRRLMEGAGDLVQVLTAAAPADPEVARVYENGRARSRAGARRIVQRLHTLGALREDLPVETAAEALYAVLDAGVWTRLVEDCGWTGDAFESWYAELLQGMLLGRQH